MKIKNKLFNVNNLSKLGFLMALMFILGCGGGGGGSSQQNSALKDFTQAETEPQAPSQIDNPFNHNKVAVDSDKADSDKADSDKADSDKADSDKSYSGKADSDKSYSGKADSDKSYSGKADSDKSYSGKADSDKSYSGKTSTGQAGNGQAGNGQAGNGQAGNGQAGNGQAEDGQLDPDVPIVRAWSNVESFIDKEIDLSNPLTLNLEVVETPEGSTSLAFQLGPENSDYFYNFDDLIDKKITETSGFPESFKYLMLAQAFPTIINIKNSTSFRLDTLSVEPPINTNRSKFKIYSNAAGSEVTATFEGPQSVADVISFMGEIQLYADLRDESGLHQAFLTIRVSPIFQVKLYENLNPETRYNKITDYWDGSSARPLKYSSTIDKYFFGADKIDFSDPNFTFGMGFRPILYIVNDTQDERDISIQFKTYIRIFREIESISFVLQSLSSQILANSNSTTNKSYEFSLKKNEGRGFLFYSYHGSGSTYDPDEKLSQLLKVSQPDSSEDMEFDLSKLLQSYNTTP